MREQNKTKNVRWSVLLINDENLQSENTLECLSVDNKYSERSVDDDLSKCVFEEREIFWMIAWVNNDNSTICKMDIHSILARVFRFVLSLVFVFYFQLHSLSSIPLSCQLPPGTICTTRYRILNSEPTIIIFLAYFMQRSKPIYRQMSEQNDTYIDSQSSTFKWTHFFEEKVTLHQSVHTPKTVLHLH